MNAFFRRLQVSARNHSAVWLLCLLTGLLYVPAFWWLIHEHWLTYGGSELGIIPLALGVYWLFRLIDGLPLRVASPCGLPLLLLLAGLWMLLAGWSADASAIMGWSLFLVITALAWLYGGVPGVQWGWFPALCLALAFPVPGVIEHYLGFYARLCSAMLAKGLLGVFGFTLERSGTFLTAASGVQLDVGNACSGVKTLHVFLVSALVLLQPLRRLPLRFFTLLPAFLLAAVLANGVRVAALVVIAEKLGAKWLESAAHELTGLVFFLLSFIPLALAVSKWGTKNTKAPEVADNKSTTEVSHFIKHPFIGHAGLLSVVLMFAGYQHVQRQEATVMVVPEAPYLLGEWAGRDGMMSEHEIQFYGVSGLRKRVYVSGSNTVEYVSNTAPVSREGLHEPTGCYSGFGWSILGRRIMTLDDSQVGIEATVLRMDRAQGTLQQVALFWFDDEKGQTVMDERHLAWHMLKRRLLLRPEEIWTLNCVVSPVKGDAWATATAHIREVAELLIQEESRRAKEKR